MRIEKARKAVRILNSVALSESWRRDGLQEGERNELFDYVIQYEDCLDSNMDSILAGEYRFESSDIINALMEDIGIDDAIEFTSEIYGLMTDRIGEICRYTVTWQPQPLFDNEHHIQTRHILYSDDCIVLDYNSDGLSVNRFFVLRGDDYFSKFRV